MRMLRAGGGLICMAVCLSFAARAIAEEATERVDEDVVKRIKDEGLNRSQAMSTISYLTDVCGPRLTAAPATRKAGEWAKGKLTEWKLENAQLEPWGPFGRGWSVDRFSISMVAPGYSPLIAYPKAWSPSTQKVVRGKPIYLDVKEEKDIDKYRGKLNKAIVLLSPPRELKPLFEPPAQRQTDADLLGLANGVARNLRSEAKGPPPAEANPAAPAAGDKPATKAPEARSSSSFLSAKWRLVHEEGVAMVLEPGRGDGGTVFVTGANMPSRSGPDALPIAGARGRGRSTPWSPDAPEMIPQAVMAVEQYNRLIRMLEFGAPVELEVDLLTQYHTEELNSFNIVAEIPGGDLKDEIVMLGAHFDSWHSGSGATDNAIGCGVAMEAARILQAIGVKPRRTIRIALWTGEEQGLLGSKAYVTEHFGKSVSASERAEAEKKAAADKSPE
jgi:carboxypeptidase Q